jgi:ABC-type methionine transport system ATPase subunit
MSMVSYRRVKITYPAALLEQPILYRLISQFGVMVNVLEANVTAESGWLLVDLGGSPAMLVQAVQWLADQGLDIEAVSD